MNIVNDSGVILQKKIEAKRSKGLAWWRKEFEPKPLAKWDISSMSVYLFRAGTTSPGKF